MSWAAGGAPGARRRGGAADRPRRAHGRARPRGRELRLLLARDDVLLDGRADDLPARVRLRVRVDRLARRRLRLRRVRGHGNGRHRGAVLERLPGDVRDVREVLVPAHLRCDPGGPRRHRGARDGRGPVDLGARGDLRLRSAARGHGLRPEPELGHADRAVHRVPDRVRLGVVRDPHRRGHEVDRELQLRDLDRHHAAVPRGRHVLPDRGPARVGAGRRPVQPALPLRAARAPRGLRLRGLGRPLPRGRPRGLRRAAWALAVSRMRRKLID